MKTILLLLLLASCASQTDYKDEQEFSEEDLATMLNGLDQPTINKTQRK